MKFRYARAEHLLPIALMVCVGLMVVGVTQADSHPNVNRQTGNVTRLIFTPVIEKSRLNPVEVQEAITVHTIEPGTRFTTLRDRGINSDGVGVVSDNRFDVDCRAGESVNAAIARGDPGRPITVSLLSDCTEDVYVRRHDVTIRGAEVDGSGAPIRKITGRIEIDASSRVSIFDLSVADSRSTGVLVKNGSSATLWNLRVSGHLETGIGISKNSYAEISKVVVTNPPEGTNAVYVDDGGDARIRDSVLISGSGAFDKGAALELSRSGHARLEGDNLIQNTGSSPGFNSALAVQVMHSSDLLIHNGANKIVGNVFIESNSNVDMREARVTGQAGVRSLSRLRLRNTVVLGDAALSRGSMLQSDGASISLGVNCSNNLSIVFNNGLAGSVGSSCTQEFPAPGF